MLSGKMFFFAFFIFGKRKLILVLVWLLTIIKLKVSRHNADMLGIQKRIA